MSGVSRLLTEGESVAMTVRPHGRVLAVPAAVLLLTLAAGGYLLGRLPGDESWSPHARVAVLAVVGLVLVLLVIPPFVRWWTTRYVFTTRRIAVRTGVLARAGQDMPYSKVNGVSFQAGPLDRLVGSGTLVVTSAAEDGELVLVGVPQAEELQREVFRLAEADEVRRRRDSAPW